MFSNYLSVLVLVPIVLICCETPIRSKRAIGIEGGKRTTANSVPYHALILKTQSQGLFEACSGVIVSETLILTNYRCVSEYQVSPKRYMVAIGVDSGLEAKKGKLYQVKKIIPQPGYQWSWVLWQVYNNFAVLVLKEPLIMRSENFTASTVTIATRSHAGEMGIVSGYGSKLWDRKLRSAEVPILSSEVVGRFTPRYGTEEYVGSGFLNTVVGPCGDLDLGGPLVVKKEKKYILVGLTWALYCSESAPDIYGNITHWYDWISDVLKSEKLVLNHDNFM